MKITRVEPLMLDHFLLVRVHTDAGITGLGESGAWGFLEASQAAIEKFGRYLIGKDPLQIEHHWQYMYRWSAFRGSAIMGAISALDIALWDIAGKHFDAPVYQLLGGKVRHRARVYHHIYGSTIEDHLEEIDRVVAQGFTALGHLNPLLDEPIEQPYERTHADLIDGAIDNVRRYREAVGNGVDLCIEIHRRLTPSEAIQLGRGIEQYRPYFFEDPTSPDNIDAMALIADRIPIPIATGERLFSIWDFEMLLKRNAAAYLRPDVCLVGGISGTKKIAALAEANYVGVVPHNPLSPVSTAACLQIAACIPNFAIQEYPLGETEPPKADMVTGIAEHDGEGYLVISDRPGIGVELKPDAVEKVPPVPREPHTRLHADGSVVDQ